MATHSTVPTVKARLVTLLTAALPTTQVWYSHPGDAVETSAVYLGAVRGSDTIPVMNGPARKKRDETYTIDVWLEAQRSGASSQEAEEAAWVLFGELEDVLADDPGLGIPTVVSWAMLEGWDDFLAFDLNSGGWSARIRAGVTVKARLT